MRTTSASRVWGNPKRTSILCGFAGVALLLVGCGGGGGGGSENPPPTVNLGANPNLVNSGSAATLTWSAANASTCTASGGWSGSRPTSGSEPTSALTSNMTYTLTCTGSGGGANGTVAVAVNQPPVANNRCFSIQNVDQSVGVTLSASDPNGNNTISSYTVPAAPSNGTIMECAGYPCTRSSPSFTYVPPNIGSSRRGMDKFTFTVTDSGALGSSTGTVTILNNGKLRIMPLGDSITLGTTVGNGCSGGDGCPEDGFVIGYRKKLLDDLTAQSSGYIVDFVGSQDEGGSVPIADTDHEGHGGFRDDQINSGISGWLNSNPPDVILLHIGTNGLNDSGGTNAADVANILTTIDNWENSNYPVTVFLAKIIKWVDGNANVATFNNNLTTMVTNRPNDRVVIVDQNSALNNILNQDMADNLHPNQTGYDKMATKWLSEMTLPANVSAKYLGLPACQ